MQSTTSANSTRISAASEKSERIFIAFETALTAVYILRKEE